MIHWTLSEAWLHALGWALLHSLWQMALLAALGGLGLRLMAGSSAASRQYAFTMLLIGFSALLFAGTAYLQFDHYQAQAMAPQLNTSPGGTELRSASEEAAALALPQTSAFSRFASLRNLLEGQLFWLVALWLLGVLLLSIRQVGHYFFLSQLRIHGIQAPEERWATKGVTADLGTDFDIECPITGYSIVHVPKNGDPVEFVNPQGPYRELSARLARMAEKGSIYYFDEVKCLCPGDEEPRKINAMVFKIR